MITESKNKVNQIQLSDISASYHFKILILGEMGVGKTSLKIRYTEDNFYHDTKANSGIDYKIKYIKIDDEPTKLSIWDTAGSERYHSIAKSYFNNAQGIMLCYNIIDEKTFQELSNFWLDFITECQLTGEKKNAPCVVYLIGTKKDLANETTRGVSIERAEGFCKQFNGKYFETSSLTGENVNEAFEALAKELIEKYMNVIQSSSPSLRLTIDDTPNIDRDDYAAKSGCC